MPVTIVNGGQYGDEGKGKIVDFLAEHYDIGIRSTAGDNAGHTVCVGDKTLKMRLIPSTILSATHSIIADDVMINPLTLVQEIQSLQAAGIDCVDRLMVSPNAHIVMPYHKVLDELYESGTNPIGTTKRGIGPAIADKVNRVGIRMEEFIRPDILNKRLLENIERINRFIKAEYGEGTPTIGLQETIDQISHATKYLSAFVHNTLEFTHRALDEDRSILIEGAQGSMNDLVYGTYPYVTSSRPISGGLLAGAGIGPTYVTEMLSVIKPYQTRVGIGPVMAEFFDEAAKNVCERGHEFGTVTGRARRVMWFDSVVVNHTRRINGTTAFALTKLDVMDELSEIKICTGYISPDGVETSAIPFQTEMDRYIPKYITMPGWQTSTANIRSYDDLPKEAKAFIRKIEELTNTPVAMISVGPDRENTIEVNVSKNMKPGKSYQYSSGSEPHIRLDL